MNKTLTGAQMASALYNILQNVEKERGDIFNGNEDGRVLFLLIRNADGRLQHIQITHEDKDGAQTVAFSCFFKFESGKPRLFNVSYEPILHLEDLILLTAALYKIKVGNRKMLKEMNDKGMNL